MAEFLYRGKTIDDLRAMPPEEFIKLIPSRNRRSIKRGLSHAQKKLMREVQKDPKKFHRTQSRDLVILPQLVGATLGVYNGQEYVRLMITPEMLGHRLGEFVLTRKTVKHSAPGFGATKSSKFVPLK